MSANRRHTLFHLHCFIGPFKNAMLHYFNTKNIKFMLQICIIQWDHFMKKTIHVQGLSLFWSSTLNVIYRTLNCLKTQKVSQTKKWSIFQILIDIKMLLKIFANKLSQMKQNMVLLRIHEVSTELHQIKQFWFPRFHA